MQEPNNKLSAFLKQWPEIEPRAAFDQDVLRRIRVERAAATESAGLGLSFLDRLAAQLTSVWGIAAAVVVATVIGFLLASATSAPDADDTMIAGLPDALSLDTISGNYVAMVEGNLR